MSADVAAISFERPRRDASFQWLTIGLAVPFIAAAVPLNLPAFADWRLLVWLAVIAGVELFPIPTQSGAQFSVTDPLTIALAIIYPSGVVLVLMLLASFDPRELKREVSFRHALWNRVQCAVCAAAGGVVFHWLATPASSWGRLTLATVATTTVYNGLNLTAAGLVIGLRDHLPIWTAIRGLLLDSPVQSAARYLSFALMGMPIARLYALTEDGVWILVSFSVPLVIVARSSYLHIRSARKAAEISQQRADLLRTISDRAAKERVEERVQLAGLLHDEAIPNVEGMNLTANIALASLDSGREAAARVALGEIREASLRSAADLRSVVGDLRRSPLDGKSLSQALGELDSTWPSGPPVLVDAEAGADIPAAAEVLLYQIAREAVTNAVNHSRGSRVHVRLKANNGVLELAVCDDGVGFDASVDRPGHFGLALMRERVDALAGELRIEPSPSGGTSVRVWIPDRWEQEESPAPV